MINRTPLPRSFILDITTSRVLPRVSFKMWTYNLELNLMRNTRNVDFLYLVNEKKFYLRQYAVVVLPVSGFMGGYRGDACVTYQLRVRPSHFSAYERSGMAHIITLEALP